MNCWAKSEKKNCLLWRMFCWYLVGDYIKKTVKSWLARALFFSPGWKSSLKFKWKQRLLKIIQHGASGVLNKCIRPFEHNIVSCYTVCNSTTEKKYKSKFTLTNPVDVIRTTDASSVIVKDLGLVQMLSCVYCFLKKVWWNKHSHENNT